MALRAHVQLQKQFLPLSCEVLLELGLEDWLAAAELVTGGLPRLRLRRSQRRPGAELEEELEAWLPSCPQLDSK